jgi:ectoine hydroxylase-related dioxygenase (phytanoyl-CoA dioxygenase family)
MSDVIDEALIADYRRDGHVTVRNVFAADDLEPYAAIVATVAAASTQHTVPMDQRSLYQRAFIQEMNLWQRHAALRPLVFDQRVADLAAELLGVERVRLYHDQALCKEPFGGPTPWHVDQQYWPIATGATVTAWIPLQDTPAELGPLRFARRSHDLDVGRDLPISEHSEQTLAGEIARRHLDVHEDSYALGDVSFHAGWTFHGARANSTDRWRRVMTMIYVADGATLLEPTRDEQLWDRRVWLPDSTVGEPIDSWLNPRVEPGVLDRLPPVAPMLGTIDLTGR